MQALQLSTIEKEVNGEVLFAIDQLNVNQGDRIGIVGENGAGKSTLLSLIAGRDLDYRGEIQRFGEIVLVAQLKDVTTDSGGEQVRKHLTRAFAKRPAILLLDEPTANLDQENQEWLHHQLERYHGTVITVSHDRAYLDREVTTIWSFEQGTVVRYSGNFSAFAEINQQRQESQLEEYQQYERKKKQLAELAQKKEVQARRVGKARGVSSSDARALTTKTKADHKAKKMAKSVTAAKKKIDQLEVKQKPRVKSTLKFLRVGNLALKQQTTLLRVRNKRIQAGNKLLFSVEDFKIGFGEHLALIGKNQSGKTTFLRELNSEQADIYRYPDLSIGYFRQNLDNLTKEQTIIEEVSEHSLQEAQMIRNILGAMGFHGADVNKQIKYLSGGERVKVSLAKVLVSDSHLLILDEPTNYLDMTAIIALEEFLEAYPGALIIVSHDRAFTERLHTKNYQIKDGQLGDMAKEVVVSSNDEDLQTLKWRRDLLMLDPDSKIDDIRALTEQIKTLE